VKLDIVKMYNRIILYGWKDSHWETINIKDIFSPQNPSNYVLAAVETLYYTEISDAYLTLLNRLLSCPGTLHLCEA